MTDKPDRKLIGGPYTPAGAEIMVDLQGIAHSRDRMSAMDIDNSVSDIFEKAVERWRSAPNTAEVLKDIRRILELMRLVPPSEDRVRQINTLAHLLGQKEHLALYIRGILRAIADPKSEEHQLFATTLQDSTTVSMYGWTAQICLAETSSSPTAGTFPAIDGLQDLIGNAPATWRISLHVWQPNERARGFEVAHRADMDLTLEPPHSHPFDFVSYVVVGEVYQSRYEQLTKLGAQSAPVKSSRYGEALFEHVDGIWPPHRFRESAALDEVEYRIKLIEGQSYYMPCNWIHDFAVDTAASKTRPSITLFISTESIVMPHAYIAPAMADFHANNPELKSEGKTIEVSKWESMLASIANYLEGSSQNLQLAKIVDHTHEYAFFHAADTNQLESTA